MGFRGGRVPAPTNTPKAISRLRQRQSLGASLVDHPLQAGAEGEVIGSRGKEACPMAGVLNAVREGQQLWVVVEHRSEYFVDGNARDGRRLCANEHQAACTVAVWALNPPHKTSVFTLIGIFVQFDAEGARFLQRAEAGSPADN